MKDTLQLLAMEKEETVDGKIFQALFEETNDGQVRDINVFDKTGDIAKSRSRGRLRSTKNQRRGQRPRLNG